MTYHIPGYLILIHMWITMILITAPSCISMNLMVTQLSLMLSTVLEGEVFYSQGRKRNLTGGMIDYEKIDWDNDPFQLSMS